MSGQRAFTRDMRDVTFGAYLIPFPAVLRRKLLRSELWDKRDFSLTKIACDPWAVPQNHSLSQGGSNEFHNLCGA
eukprot:130601-Chlamydomonas_euryale.AAC.1